MSTTAEIPDGFSDEVAESVAKAAAAGPQRLPEMSLTECRACHTRVYFRARSSTPTSDPHFKVEYLYCPVCGATATQLREVEILPQQHRHRTKVRYRYDA